MTTSAALRTIWDIRSIHPLRLGHSLSFSSKAHSQNSGKSSDLTSDFPVATGPQTKDTLRLDALSKVSCCDSLPLLVPRLRHPCQGFRCQRLRKAVLSETWPAQGCLAAVVFGSRDPAASSADVSSALANSARPSLDRSSKTSPIFCHEPLMAISDWTEICLSLVNISMVRIERLLICHDSPAVGLFVHKGDGIVFFRLVDSQGFVRRRVVIPTYITEVVGRLYRLIVQFLHSNNFFVLGVSHSFILYILVWAFVFGLGITQRRLAQQGCP